MTVTSQ